MTATTAPVAAVGVDIDPVLIQRAVKKQVLGLCIGQTIEADSKKAPLTDSDSRTQAVFLCGDFTTALTQQAIAKQLSAFACKTGDRFSLVTCFSVTMWIHLHHGGTDYPIMHGCCKGARIGCMYVQKRACVSSCGMCPLGARTC